MKSHNNFIYYVEYVTIEKYLKIYNINLLYLILRYVNRYFDEINGNKYLTLVATNESKEKTKKFEDQWIKITDLIRSITKIYDAYDEKYMKIKFNSDNELPLNKTVEITTITIVVRAIFLENNKYYPQIFLDQYLYKI